MKENIWFPKIFPTLYTERLQLIHIKQKDSIALHEFLSGEEVRKYIGILAYEKIEETEKEIQGYDKCLGNNLGIRTHTN